MRRHLLEIFAAIVAACAVLMSARAHHSYSEYDDKQMIEVEGTLVGVALQNPHVHFKVEGTDENGRAITWDLEATSLNWLQRLELPPDVLQVGGRVKFAGWPSKRAVQRVYALNMLAANGQEVLLFRTATPRWASAALGFGAAEAQTFYSGGVANNSTTIFHVWASDLDDRETGWTPAAPLQLTEAAQNAVAAFDPINDSAAGGCTPKAMPLPMSQPPPMELVDRGDTILLRLEEYDMVRTIHLSRSLEPARQPLTPLGFSVGRWDGTTLVVETTRLNGSYLNAAGVPLGANAHLLERFTPDADGSRLNYSLTVTAPDSLTAPAQFSRAWVWRPGEQVLPFECTE